MRFSSFINSRTMVVALIAWAISQALPAVTWVEEANHKWRPLDVPSGTSSGFTVLAPEQTGIHFSNRLNVEKSLQNQVYLNGSGIALADVNGDGLCDIYLCGLDSPNHLYLNKGGWSFEEVAGAKTPPGPRLPTWMETAPWI